MKSFVTYLLILTILVRPLQYLSTELNYMLRIDEIAEKYCVNKNTPQMACNGKCYLAKQLQIELTDTKDKLMESIAFVFVPVFFQKVESLSLVTINTIKYLKATFTYLNFYLSVKVNQIFKPPIF